MSSQSYLCLSIQVLDQIGQNEISPDELLHIEEHVSECRRCREMFDSVYSSTQWSEHIRPALVETQILGSSKSDDEADHQFAVLKLLGPTDDPNMLGRIGNYEIVGVIGQGGMGAVFKGFDRSLNRFVAIKMLLPHLASSGTSRKRFAREGQAVAAVVDDHVMAIHCVDEWQGVPYLVMTYSRGVSLQKRLNDHGPLEVREILRIGMQAAKGLAAAHAQGIVHRDIKPSNILLDQNVERVQLVDFGLARAVDDASLTCSGTLAGTPQYMSPEQARAETVDHRSDLFSLGSVLYAMCVGHAPFRSESSYSVLRLITDKEPRPIREVNSEIPDWLCAIIRKLMSKSPDDRFASANEVAIIFERCLAHVQDPIQHALPPVTQEFHEQSKSKWMIVSRLLKWFPIMNDKRIVSLISWILLLIALLVPWTIATIGNVESALAFAVPAALLSLGLALLSRSEYFSRIVLWCFGLAFGLAVIGIGISVPIKMLRESNALVIASEAARVAEMQAVVAAKNVPQIVGVDDELGVITIKGTKEGVERTKAIINSIQKSQQNTVPDSSKNQENSLSDAAPQNDSLEGVWEGIHYGDGEEFPDKKRLRIVFTKDLHAAFSGTQLLWTATFIVKPQYSPTRLYYVVDGKPKRGIYEVKEDGLRLNMVNDMDAMPTKFGTEHAEFKRLKGTQSQELVDKLMATVEKSKDSGGSLPKYSTYVPFPKELHGTWRIQNATTLTSKRTEYIDQNVFIDQDSLLLTAGDQSNRYRLSHWKHRDDNQSIEADLTAESPSGQDSKTFRCLMEIRGDELLLLRQQNEHFDRPKSVDDISSSITRFTMTRESASSSPKAGSPLEAIEIAKRFANADHGKAIGMKFRVASVHPPFVSGGDKDRGHSKSELHLDFRPLPANFTEDQFLVVLTQEAIDQLKKLGIENIEAHFLNKEIEATGRILATMYTPRGMPGRHFHLIVSDLKQITFVGD